MILPSRRGESEAPPFGCCLLLPSGYTIVPLLGQNLENGIYSQNSYPFLPVGLFDCPAIPAVTVCIDSGNASHTLCGTNLASTSNHFAKPPGI